MTIDELHEALATLRHAESLRYVVANCEELGHTATIMIRAETGGHRADAKIRMATAKRVAEEELVVVVERLRSLGIEWN